MWLICRIILIEIRDAKHNADANFGLRTILFTAAHNYDSAKAKIADAVVDKFPDPMGAINLIFAS